MSYQSINPYNGQLLKTFAEMTQQELEAALKTAAEAYEKWRELSYAERSKIVSKAALLMAENIEALALLVTQDMGKLIAESRGEVKLSADIIAYYAKHAKTFLGPQNLNPSEGDAQIECSPIGVLALPHPTSWPATS